MEIQTASFEELRAARDEINARLRELEKLAIEELEAKAKQFGFQLVKPNAGYIAPKPAVRYRDAQGNTWSGKGRKPGWVAEAEAAGVDLEQFRVQ